MSDFDPYDGKPSARQIAIAAAQEEERKAFVAALKTRYLGSSQPAPDVAGGQLLAMFFKLDAYGQRVVLAQVAAMVRVQGGAA